MCRSSGFTLIEIMIYLGIVALTAVGFVSYGVTISQLRAKSTITADVQAQARAAISIIGEKIHASSGVNISSSVLNSDPGVLSLAMDDGSKNPTIIDLDADNGRLRIREGAFGPAYLTGKLLAVKNLQFRNLTDGARENIVVDMTIGYTDADDAGYLYDYTVKSAYGPRK